MKYRLVYPFTGSTLNATVTRQADNHQLDQADGLFSATPADNLNPMTEVKAYIYEITFTAVDGVLYDIAIFEGVDLVYSDVTPGLTILSLASLPTEGDIAASILGNLSAGVFQNLLTTIDNAPLNVNKGDYLPAGTITFNFGSQWFLSGQIIYFTVKKNKTDTIKLIDVLCTLTDAANVIGNVGEIDLTALGLAAGDYNFEYRRYQAAGTEPMVIRQGKFHVNQDIRH